MFNQQIYEEASEWFVRMRDCEDDPSVQGALMDWLRRSPEHVRAYLDIAAIWMEAKNVQADSHLDLTTRIAAARADRGVTDLAPGIRQMSRRYLNTRGLLAVAASVFIVCVGAAAAWWQYGREVYSTQIGEQRSIALADGSTVELNSQSRVRVRFDNRQRRIELLEGQALFHVTKDPARPFLVRADRTTVRAVGTVFDVYRKRGTAVITVVEGVVVVEHNEAEPAPTSAIVAEQSHEQGERPFPPVRLAAGRQVIVKPGAGVEASSANVAAAIAWTQRQLVFEFTPLVEVAEEFNRYNARKLVIETGPLRAFKISAIFRSTDPRSLVRFVQAMPGVQVRESDDEIVISAAPQRRSLN